MRLLTFLSFLVIAPLLAMEPVTFPTIDTVDLNGKKFHLPTDFGPRPVWLIVAFEREQQTECDRILSLLEGNPALDDVQIFELPVIDQPGALMRWFIRQGMKNGISDRSRRGQVLTLHVDLNVWKKTMHIADNNVYLLRSDSTGSVQGMIPTAKIKTAEDLHLHLTKFPAAGKITKDSHQQR